MYCLLLHTLYIPDHRPSRSFRFVKKIYMVKF